MFENAFHEGEQAVQARYGLRDKMAVIGQRVMRPFMPEQHREFFALLPLVFLGSRDPKGRPWASVMFGEPGFVSTPDNTTITIAGAPIVGDPLAENLNEGAYLGLLGLQFETRRRNRANGRLVRLDEKELTIHVDMSFGNCPKYIQVREGEPVAASAEVGKAYRTEHLDETMQTVIKTSDTFFIASATASTQGPEDIKQEAYGVDVSHRGGPTGFTRILDDRRFVYPDYSGNFFFNTLGNLTSDPRSGYLFLDFATGNVLQLTGRTEIVYEPTEEIPFDKGAQRMLAFTLEEALFIPNAIPMTWSAPQFSPHLPK
ncbi:MAG: pyridoxamine 5'-phosphate oxidase family protein [Acidobacteriota bacterium]|nr:pyridoxamine 5'-phosphate oxidase family protein [Acidobacteriota bacterium]